MCCRDNDQAACLTAGSWTMKNKRRSCPASVTVTSSHCSDRERALANSELMGVRKPSADRLGSLFHDVAEPKFMTVGMSPRRTEWFKRGLVRLASQGL